jgi:post-segregation antitoxin (ccd killing protein)
MSAAVLCVRVRREVREEVKRLGIDVRSVVEKALEEEIVRVKVDRLRSLIEEALKHMNVSVDEWVKTIKESRYER